MNAIDFIRESAKVLTDYRPDVYDVETAVEELSTSMDQLRSFDIPVASIMFTSFILTRLVDDGVEEFILSHKLTGLFICEEEEDVQSYAFDESITGLPHILDAGRFDDFLDTDDDT